MAAYGETKWGGVPIVDAELLPEWGGEEDEAAYLVWLNQYAESQIPADEQTLSHLYFDAGYERLPDVM